MAATGVGVFDTLKAVAKLVLTDLTAPDLIVDRRCERPYNPCLALRPTRSSVAQG